MSARRSRLEFSHAIMHEIFRFRLMYKLIATLVLTVTFLIGYFYPERYKAGFSFKLLEPTAEFSLIENTQKKLDSYEFLSQVSSNLKADLNDKSIDITALRSSLNIGYENEMFHVSFITHSASRSFQFANAVEALLFESENTGEKLREKRDQLAVVLIEKRLAENTLIELDAKIGSYKSLSIKTDLVKVSNKVRRLKDSLDDVNVELLVVNKKVDLLKRQIDDEIKLQSDLKEYHSLVEREQKLSQVMNDSRKLLEQKKQRLGELENNGLELNSAEEIASYRQETLELEEQIYKTETQCIDLRATISEYETNQALLVNSNLEGGSLYSQLREQLASTNVEKKALETRKESLKAILAEEIKNEQVSEAELFGLEELNKEYSLNVRKKERIDSNIATLERDIEQLKPLYKSVAHAELPVHYEGLGFREFLLIGPLVAILMPFIIAVLIILFDSRVRTSQQLYSLIPNNLPLLEVIPHFDSPMGMRVVRNTLIGFALWAVIVICSYVFLGVIGLGVD